MKIPGSHIPKEGMGVTDDELQWLYNQAKDMNSIIEIGSYKGRSTFALCFGCRGTVYSVDNFCTNGEQAYKEYMQNVGFMPNIVTLKMTSEEAAEYLGNMVVDMAFIDGSHDDVNVKRDIEIWAPRCRKLICGHDYNGAAAHAGLCREVDAHFPDRQIGADFIWYKRLI